MKPGSQQASLSNHQTSQGLTQHIIDNYRSITTSVRQDYLDYLTAKSAAYAESARQTASREITAKERINRTMVALVDRVFHLLEPYALELNRVNGLRDLHLSSQPPSVSTEASEYDHMRRPGRTTTYYRARFSTSRFSLVIRGIGGRIDFFMLPTDRIMGLSRIEAETAPLMTFAAGNVQTQNQSYELTAFDSDSWIVEGKLLNADRLERFSLLALEHLLDRTQEDITR
jgi:hypothetical protein